MLNTNIELVQKCKLLFRQIYSILAQGLFSGTQDIKHLVLQVTRAKLFALDQLSLALKEVEALAHIQQPVNHNATELSQNFIYPVMSVAQNEKLEELITTLSNATAQNNLSNISTSDVVELYEYKVASLSHAELAALTSAEAASQRCTHLQHRMAQLTAQLTKTNQMSLHMQQQYKNVVKEKEEYIQKYKEYLNKVDSEKGLNKVLRGQLALKDMQLEEKEQVLNEQKDLINKLEGNISKMESQLKKKEELLNKSNVTNEELREVNSLTFLYLFIFFNLSCSMFIISK